MPSLASKVAVVKLYALSRVYYVGSILPITKTTVKKFESIIGKFIWASSGWFLRVSFKDIKNTPQKGGLGMVCVGSMCNSLMFGQFLRLLKSDYKKSLNHIGYWIGDFLDDLLPGIVSGPRAHEVPAYFDEIVALVMEARFDDLIT